MTGFVNAIVQFFRKNYHLKGRSCRSEFWWIVLFALIADYIIRELCLIAYVDYRYGYGGVGEVYKMMAGWIIVGLLTIPVTVRRFHDRNLSGWWFLIIWAWMALGPMVFPGGVIVFWGLGGLVTTIICVRRGTAGPNRFGEDPLGQTAAATQAAPVPPTPSQTAQAPQAPQNPQASQDRQNPQGPQA